MAENKEGLDHEQDDLNEDLFDFPSDAEFADDLDAPSAMAGSSGLDDPGTGSPDDDIFSFETDTSLSGDDLDGSDLKSGTANLEKLLDSDPEAAGSSVDGDSPETAEAQPPAGDETDLDEDIFNFNNPTRSSSAESPATGKPVTLHHADLIDKQEENVAPEVGKDEQPATTAPQEEAAPAPAPTAEAPAPKAEPEPSAPTAADAPASPSLEGTAAPLPDVARQSAANALAVAKAARLALLSEGSESAPIQDRGWNRRMVISVAAAFLLVNASLIFIAGRLSQSLNSALDGVRQDLSRTIPIAQESAPVNLGVPTIEAGPTPPPVIAAEKSAPTTLMDVASRELEVAHREIEDGEFAAARRRLYRLLANRDRLIISADVLAESEFLVAESYFAEAKKLDTLVVEAEQ